MLSIPHTENRNRGRLLITLRWLAAAAVIGVLLHFLPFHLLGEAIRRVPLTTFLLALCGYLCAHAVGVVKWRMVVNAAGGQLDFPTSAQCYTGGLFGTLFLPSIIGGDVVRIAVGLRRSPNPAGVLAGNVADRLVDMTAQAGLVLLGIVLLPRALPANVQAQGQKMILCGGIAMRDSNFVRAAVVPAAFWRAIGKVSAAIGAHAARGAKRFRSAACFGICVGAGNGNSDDIPGADGVAGASVWIISAIARLVFCMAAGETGGTSAHHARRNRSARSRDGCAAVPFRGSGAPGFGRGVGVGSGSYRRRIDGWTDRIPFEAERRTGKLAGFLENCNIY